MSAVQEILLLHMADTCRSLALRVLWEKLCACNWVDGEFNEGTLLGSFEFMRANTPEHPNYEIWVHRRENIEPAIRLLRLFGYAFEANWLARRSKFALGRLEQQDRYLMSLSKYEMKIPASSTMTAETVTFTDAEFEQLVKVAK